MKELKAIAFNHGRLCELLRAANDAQLANVIEDVKKIQEERRVARKSIHLLKIREAIQDAIKDGYDINISTMDDISAPDCVIHMNNWFCTAIALEEEEDE